MSQIAGALLEFAAGATIFNEGDPGGDLYFIKEGEVEVFKAKAGVEVTLTLLHPGEVLGIMTCLTREPRLASARAHTDVKALIVKQAGIKSLIQTTPTWVHSVIKDFTLRVKNIDQLYWHAVAGRGGVESSSPSVQLAAAVVNGLAELGSFTTAPTITADRGLRHLSRILDVSIERLDASLSAVVECGLLESDREIDVARLQKVAAQLAAAVQRFHVDAGMRRAGDAFTAEDIETLGKIAAAATELGVRPDDEASMQLRLLTDDGLSLDAVRQALMRGSDVGIARLAKGGEDHVATFVPSTLTSQIAALKLVRKLREQDRKAPDSGAVNVITEAF